jgi:hypothetical protein
VRASRTIIQECLLRVTDDLVESFTRLKDKTTASRKQIQNLHNWLDTYPNAIDPEEQHFRDQEGDLFMLQTTAKSPLFGMLYHNKVLRRLLGLGKRSDRVDHPSTAYASERGMETAISMLSLFVDLTMLFASVWWLNFVDANNVRLGIITGSVFLFTMWCWLAAGNRPFEILAAVAGYTAVLMIFRQLGS